MVISSTVIVALFSAISGARITETSATICDSLGADDDAIVGGKRFGGRESLTWHQ